LFSDLLATKSSFLAVSHGELVRSPDTELAKVLPFCGLEVDSGTLEKGIAFIRRE
jgi:hypothetical protein